MCNMLDCLIHVNSLSVVGDILPFKPCNSIVSGYWMVFKPFWSEIEYRVISTIVVWVWILKTQHFTDLKSEL